MMTATIRTLAPLTSDIRITAKHPVRNEFAGCSTGSGGTGYYPTKGHAVNRFDAVLQGYDLYLDRDDLADFHGSDGMKTIEVLDEFKHCAGHAVLSWYRVENGSYEFVGYLA
jgi:hypothetical protein